MMRIHKKEIITYVSFILVMFILTWVASGCASTQKTTRSETSVTYSDEGAGNKDSLNSSEAEKRIETTTATSTETKADHPGVISSTVHAIGYVISLPFILVGHLLRAIF